MRNSTVIGRVVATGALGLTTAVVALILLSGGSSYHVRAVFQNASQIVSGDQVQVAGNAIGSVSDIELTPNGLAQLTLTIDDSRFAPLARAPRRLSARRRCRESPTATSIFAWRLPPRRRSRTTG